MEFRFNYFSLLSLATTILTSWVALMAWERRSMRGAKSLFALMLVVAYWAICDALENSVIGIPQKVFWGKVQYIGTLWSPVFILFFAFEYANMQNWLTRKKIIAVMVVPFITYLLTLTNEWHGWIWPWVKASDSIPNLAVFGHGLAWWILVVGYSDILILIGTFIIIHTSIRLPRDFFWQSTAIVASILFPYISSILYVFGINPFPGVELTPLFASISGLLMAWGILDTGILSVEPITRQAIIEALDDGILVLDKKNRIVDSNPVLPQLLHLDKKISIGTRVDSIFDLFSALNNINSKSDNRKNLDLVIEDGKGGFLQIRHYPLQDSGGNISGYLILFRDITEEQRKIQKIELFDKTLNTRLNEIKRLQAQLDTMSITDESSGLFSRKYFDETIKREFMRAGRGKFIIALLLIKLTNVDNIKTWASRNETQEAIKRFSSYLLEQKRTEDTVCRFSPDHFILVSYGGDFSDHSRRFSDLLDRYQRSPVKVNDQHLGISASAGYFPKHGENAQDMLESLQKALDNLQDENRITYLK